ncbi:MAG: hypothetical protein IPM13_11820 [Phycisphaerales bacterium]|nr:hypothetical protein [Phycisphaerales bacterium]
MSMALVSGPAKAERNWQLLRTVLFLGFAGWFIKDGLYGYPNAIASKARDELLKPDPWGGKVQYEDLADTPTHHEFEALQKSTGADADQVAAKLGTAQVTRPEGATRELRYYASRWGYAVVPFERGRPVLSGATWTNWHKTREEVQQQFYWALVPAIPGLYFLYRLYKAVTLKVVVDDEGLLYDNRRIGWDQMTALRGYNPKGWIDLYYQDGGQERKLRFDNEKFLLFDDVVAAICQKKGFINEIEVHRADEARRRADEQAAAAAEEQAGSDADSPREEQRP